MSIDIHGLRELVQSLAPPLAMLEPYNTTPALVGSWKATSFTSPYRPEPPRPTDIAGKTRWWLRSIIAAGFYELEGLHLTHDIADTLIEYIMGSTREASRITISVDTTPMQERLTGTRIRCPLVLGKEKPHSLRRKLLREPCRVYDAIEKCSSLCSNTCIKELDCLEAAILSRRVLLQLLNKKPCEARELLPLPPCFYNFRLIVSQRPYAWTTNGLRRAALRVLGRALGMALFFTGIGRMTTRGYGKLAPSNLNSLEEQAMENPLAETLYETYRLLAQSELKVLARKATEDAKAYLTCLTLKRHRECVKALERARVSKERNQRHGLDVPVIPVFHPDYIEYSIVDPSKVRLGIIQRSYRCKRTIVECGEIPGLDSTWCVLAAISEATSRRVLGRALSTPGLDYVLGLPRMGKSPESKRRGRHVSLIQFSYIKGSNSSTRDDKLLVVGFRSCPPESVIREDACKYYIEKTKDIINGIIGFLYC